MAWGPVVDFFVSFAPVGERWATWITWQLEGAGYQAMIQTREFVVSNNLMDFMDRGVPHAAVVAVVGISRFDIGELDGFLPEVRAYRDWRAL